MTKTQRRSIYNHWNKGGNLCCEPGLKFLKTVLTEKQAVKFERWAYEELSCKGVDTEYKKDLTLKLLRKLAGVS